MADPKDDDREDYFEILELTIEATADKVKDAYKKLALKYHPDKNIGDPKAADRFVLINKARNYLMDDSKRTKLAEKKRRHAERDKMNKKRFEEMDDKRKRFKSQLETKENEERTKRARTKGGLMGAYGDADKRPGVNISVLDELRKMGLKQREEEARRMEEMLKANSAAAAMNGNGVKEVEDDDDDGEECTDADAAAAKLGIGVSSEVKVRWKRKGSSHSDETLWRLFNRFGQVNSVELTGSKGNTARVVFQDRSSAEAAVKAYELSQEMRVTIPADKRYKIFQKAFDPSVPSRSSTPTTDAPSKSTPAAPGPPAFAFPGAASGGSAPRQPGFESDLLGRMRQAAAERRRMMEQQQQEQQQQPPPPQQQQDQQEPQPQHQEPPEAPQPPRTPLTPSSSHDKAVEEASAAATVSDATEGMPLDPSGISTEHEPGGVAENV